MNFPEKCRSVCLWKAIIFRLYVLGSQGNQLQLVDAQVLKMTKALETVKVQKEIFSDTVSDMGSISDLSKELEDGELQSEPEDSFNISWKRC